MSKEGSSFEAWLEKARLGRERLNVEQLAVLQAAFRLLERGGHDYASRRMVEHFLLHAGIGLKVAQVARLVGLDRCTSSRHRPCSSSQVVQAIHNRQAGKFPGKLLPRYAGPVAQFLLEHPQATRDEVRDLLVRATPGHVELRDQALPLTRRVLEAGQPRHLRAYDDAGAGKSDADVRALLDYAAATPNLEVTLRAVRYLHRLRQWKETPAEQFERYEEPGPYVDAPPKEIYVAETRTVLKGEDESQAVRTILGRDVVRGPKKDRWNPLYTSTDGDPYQEIQDFRQRQHHEQAYRIGVYDQFLDAVPCGYDKRSPNPKRPRFPRGPLQMVGWLVALVLNAVRDLTDQLPGRFRDAHVRTSRSLAAVA